MPWPPEKRSAPAGNRGAEIDRTGKIDHRENSRPHQIQQEPIDLPDRWINIGQETIGRIYRRQGHFGAFSDDGDWLGEHHDVAAARNAIWQHHVALQLRRAA
jgi:hypothetical protein